MREIKISKFESPDKTSDRDLRKRYWVMLPGEDHYFYFKNKKDCKRFLAELSRITTHNMYELNYLTGNVYVVYRQLWGYVHDTKSIAAKFENIDRAFELAISRSELSGSGLETLNRLYNVVDNLHTIINILAATARQNKKYQTKYHLSTYTRMLDVISSEIFNFGMDSKYQVDNDTKKLR